MCNFFAQPDALALGKDKETLSAAGVPEHMLEHIFRHVLEHVSRQVPRHVLKHMIRHMPQDRHPDHTLLI